MFKPKWLSVLFALFLLSCSEQKEPIRIGAVLPLTGTFSVYGEQALKGAQLAVEQINQQGGIENRQIELIVRDNNTDPAKTVLYSRELIERNHVLALMGPVSSSSRYAMSEIATQFRIPMMYGIDYEGRHHSEFLICYSTIPEHYVDPVIPFFADAGKKSFYVFGYDYIWPHRMAKRIQESVEKNQGTMNGIEFTAFGVQDYRKTLERIEASGSDVLMLILPGQDGFQFIRQFRQFNFSRHIDIVAFAADETYLAALEPEQLEGIYSALHFVSQRQSESVKQFLNDYRQLHGEDAIVTYSSKSHYDLIYLLKAAIEKANPITPQQIMNNLHGLSMYSGDERIYLREDHHFDLPMYLGQFTQGTLTVVKEFGVISPHDQRSGEQ